MSLRDAYKQKLSAKVEEQRAKLSLMKAHAKRLAADTKIVTYEELGQAERSVGRLTSKLKKLAGASLHALGDVKGGMGRALDDLNVSTKRAANRLSEAASEPVRTPAHPRRAAKRRVATPKTVKAVRKVTRKVGAKRS